MKHIIVTHTTSKSCTKRYIASALAGYEGVYAVVATVNSEALANRIAGCLNTADMPLRTAPATVRPRGKLAA